MWTWANAIAAAITVCLFVLPVSSLVGLTGNCSGNGRSETLEISGPERDALSCTLLESKSRPPNNAKGCRNGILPPTVRGEFMGAPQSLKVEGHLFEDNSGNFHPQVEITWEPPTAAAGFHNLKGFYMEIYNRPSNQFRCYVFDFSQSNFTSSDYKLKFTKKLLGLDGGSHNQYLLKMYTLPMSRASMHKGQFFTLQPFQDGKSPGNWSPALSYETDDRQAPARITVRFSRAPKEYNFLTYIVKLLGDRDQLNAIHRCSISTHHPSKCQGQTIDPPHENDTSMAVTFYDLEADRYQIQIQPEDPYRDKPGKCLCYEKPSSTSRRCVSCLATRTDVIIVDSQEAALTSQGATDSSSPVQAAESKPSTSPLATHTPSRGQAEESTVSMTFITAVAIVPVLLGCGLVLTVVVVLWAKKQRVAHRLIYRSIPSNKDPDPGTQGHRALYSRKVYLIYAEDHKDHTKVITNLAIHLKKQCYCEVFFPRWFPREIQTMGAYEWTLSHIDQADFVIIINSEAAFKLFEARHVNKSLRRLDEGPEGDMFSLALTHVLAKSSEPWFFKKTILAYFDYTDEDFLLKDIYPGVHYRLPKHFKDLVCHIHEMSGQSDIDEMIDLKATSSGRQLLEAITKAKHFQMLDPQWFDKRFFCQEDSGFDSISPKCESSVGVDDSVSIATRPVRRKHVHPSESDNADESKSAVTYNTDYARAQGQCVFDMLPPSEVSIGASTDSIYRLMDNINKLSEINTVRFIPVHQMQTDADETAHSTNLGEIPKTAAEGHSQSDSLVTMGGRDV
ncbi:interleukin-17 receptor A-like isoform X2 [Haliotis asinina]|uniref:interleukin-17 receptor A-like isoform X2 n=1 Tax=Haliotis asinina TaxID=109174 RepID=UPI003532430F